MISTFDFIRQTLIDKFEVDPELISPEATLEVMGLDSLTMVELLFDVSEKYEIEIPTDQLDFTTLGEAIELIDAALQAKNS
ncbi:MAG: phosphopantetheine-binding protein [Nitrosomonadaceae bacterium]